MKCLLRLRAIYMLGSGPDSDAKGSSTTQTEVGLSQATPPFYMLPPTVKLKLLLFFFFFKDMKLLEVSLTWQEPAWGFGLEELRSTRTQKQATCSSPPYTHIRIHRMVLWATYTHFFFVSHLSYSLSLHVTDSFFLEIQSVPISFNQSHSLILSSNPIALQDI